MTVVQTLLVYVVIPAALYGVIALLTLVPKMTRNPKYRSGQEWTYDPVWWSANTGGAGSAHADSSVAADAQAGEPVRTARGGSRGNW